MPAGPLMAPSSPGMAGEGHVDGKAVDPPDHKPDPIDLSRHVAGPNCPRLVECPRDQARTDFFEERWQGCDLTQEPPRWQFELSALPVMTVHHPMRPDIAMERAFPFRDPADPRRVHPRYADARGEVSPWVAAHSASLTSGSVLYLAAQSGLSAKEMARLRPLLQADVLAEMQRLSCGQHAPPRYEVKRLIAADLPPHEQALAGQHGLFALPEEDPARRYTLGNGRVLGIYLGALIETEEQESAYLTDYPHGASYLMDFTRRSGRLVGLCGLGVANGVVFANTALQPESPPQYDVQRINALYVPFDLRLTDARGRGRQETVIALVGLDRLYHPGSASREVRVSYGDDFLREFQVDRAAAAPPVEIKQEPPAAPAAPAARPTSPEPSPQAMPPNAGTGTPPCGHATPPRSATPLRVMEVPTGIGLSNVTGESAPSIASILSWADGRRRVQPAQISHVNMTLEDWHPVAPAPWGGDGWQHLGRPTREGLEHLLAQRPRPASLAFRGYLGLTAGVHSQGHLIDIAVLAFRQGWSLQATDLAHLLGPQQGEGGWRLALRLADLFRSPELLHVLSERPQRPNESGNSYVQRLHLCAGFTHEQFATLAAVYNRGKLPKYVMGVFADGPPIPPLLEQRDSDAERRAEPGATVQRPRQLLSDDELRALVQCCDHGRGFSRALSLCLHACEEGRLIVPPQLREHCEVSPDDALRIVWILSHRPDVRAILIGHPKLPAECSTQYAGRVVARVTGESSLGVALQSLFPPRQLQRGQKIVAHPRMKRPLHGRQDWREAAQCAGIPRDLLYSPAVDRANAGFGTVNARMLAAAWRRHVPTVRLTAEILMDAAVLSREQAVTLLTLQVQPQVADLFMQQRQHAFESDLAYAVRLHRLGLSRSQACRYMFCEGGAFDRALADDQRLCALDAARVSDALAATRFAPRERSRSPLSDRRAGAGSSLTSPVIEPSGGRQRSPKGRSTAEPDASSGTP